MAARDGYSKYSLDPNYSGMKIMTPANNYLMGGVKSHCYEGANWYVPSERRWEKYHHHQHLPTGARRDAIDFQREEDYVQFALRRDRPKAPMITSYIPCGVPEWKTNGHRRIDVALPTYGQFTPSTRFPQWNGPGYYGYYHEALDRHRSGEFRTLPALPRYPGYPLVSQSTGL